MRELLRAVATNKRIIPLIDSHDNRRDWTAEDVSLALRRMDGEALSNSGTPQATYHDGWGKGGAILAKELEGWLARGGSAEQEGEGRTMSLALRIVQRQAVAEQLLPMLGVRRLDPPSTPGAPRFVYDDARAVEWSRIAAYQMVTMRLIAQQLLPEAVGPTHMRGELVVALGPYFASLAAPMAHRLYCSASNAGVVELCDELDGVCREFSRESRLFHSLQDTEPSCDVMLLYLRSTTWENADVVGSTAHTLARDFWQALHADKRVVVAYEDAGIGQEERSPIDFDEILRQVRRWPRRAADGPQH